MSDVFTAGKTKITKGGGIKFAGFIYAYEHIIVLFRIFIYQPLFQIYLYIYIYNQCGKADKTSRDSRITM